MIAPNICSSKGKLVVQPLFMHHFSLKNHFFTQLPMFNDAWRFVPLQGNDTSLLGGFYDDSTAKPSGGMAFLRCIDVDFSFGGRHKAVLFSICPLFPCLHEWKIIVFLNARTELCTYSFCLMFLFIEHHPVQSYKTHQLKYSTQLKMSVDSYKFPILPSFNI